MSGLDHYQKSSLSPPPGVTPNFVDPPSTAPASRIITGLTLGLMYCFLALRIYTRVWVTYSFGVDDLLCLAAAITVTAFCGVSFSKYGHPLGPHQWDIPIYEIDIHSDLTSTLVNDCLYALTSLFLKSALQALYLRIFKPAKSARILIWISLIFILLFYLIILLVNIAICAPPIANGNIPEMPLGAFDPDEGCTVPQRPIWVTMGIFSVITDFYLLAIPVGLTLNVRLALRRKIGVCCIFLTGLLACCFSIISTVYRFQMYHSDDITWLAALNYAFTAAELNIGIICSCMPIVCAIFRGSTKTIWWAWVVNVVTFGRNHGSDGRSSMPDDHHGIPEERLPQNYKGAIYLRSLVHKTNHPQPRWVEERAAYNELDSLDEDYHTQLKKESSFILIPPQARTMVDPVAERDLYTRARTVS
ncbi:hypothetical protein F4818DRAFT_288001 [Hypoxylon cercidicola]|nr:hypothetical protein F4818DRAFT_288001 [Hypoxylon cercidicola]